MSVQVLKNLACNTSGEHYHDFYCWSFIIEIIPANLKVAGFVLYQQNVTVKCCYKFSFEK